MTTVRADLSAMRAFIDAAKEIVNAKPSGLLAEIASLRASYDRFQERSRLGKTLPVANPTLIGTPGAVDSVLAVYAQNVQRDTGFAEAVMIAFEEADDGDGVVDLARFNREFGPALDAVAGRLGVPAEALLSAHTAFNQEIINAVNSPVAAGIPRTSGFVVDPICTATGHFVEEEEDFTWPERLAVLRWRRVYSSRFVGSGPFGRGWASWASAACVARADGSIAYSGPDGQAAEFQPEARPGTYRRVPGLAATFRALPGASLSTADGQGTSSSTSDGPGRTNGSDDGGSRASGWELVWDWASPHPGAVWQFDDQGRPAEVVRPASGRTGFTYEDDRLVAVTHDSGRRLTIDWDGQRIVAVRSSCGRVARYCYDDAGDLVHTERVLGDRTYTVDERGLIVEVHDADGVRLCRNTYDRHGRVMTQVSPFGRETVLRYEPLHRTVVSDGSDGPVTSYEHDDTGRLTGLVDDLGYRMDRSFDPEGRILAMTGFDGGLVRNEFDPDGATASHRGVDGPMEHWTYDELHRVTSHQVDGGPSFSFDYADDGAVPSRISGPEAWELSLDSTGGLLRSLEDADGVRITLGHDADGNVVALRNALGVLTRVVPHVSGEPALVTLPDGSKFTYDRDPAGRVVAVRVPTGDVYRVEWTPAGRLRALVEPNGARTELGWGAHGEVDRVVDPHGAATELVRDEMSRVVGVVAPGGAKWELAYTALGLLSMVTDPAGGVWRYDYDAEGRRVAATDPLGHTVRQRYDAAGRLVELTDRRGEVTRFSHDALGRVLREERSDGAVTQREWDGWNRLAAVQHPDGDRLRYHYTPGGRVARVETAEGRVWTHGYDEAGRLVSVTDPSGGVTRFEWDACDRKFAATTPGGATTRWRYDALGRVIETERGGRAWRTAYDHAGRVVVEADPTGATTRFAYDLRGNLIAATDPLGHTVRYQYDERGNQTVEIDPFGGTVTTSFDGLRRPVAVTDQLGRVTRVERDAAGRAIGQVLPTGDVVQWRRNAAGAVTDTRVNGRDAIVFDHDRCGRPVVIHEPARNRTFRLGYTPGGRIRSLDVNGRRMRWQHDRDGHVIARTDPDGRTTRYTYDRAGRVRTVEFDELGAFDLERDAEGRLVALRGPGIERRWDNEDGRLVVRSRLDGHGGEQTVELAHDPAGRVAEMRTDRGVTHYRYDGAGQLVAASRGTDAWSWSYDPAGRVDREDGPGGTRTFVYDDAHQLAHSDGQQGRTSFRYDDAGRRVEETGPSGTRRYTWDGFGRLVGVETDGRRRSLDVDALGQLAGVDGAAFAWDPTCPVSELLALADERVVTAGGAVLGLAGLGGTMAWLPGEGLASTDRDDGRDPWGALPSRTDTDAPTLGYLGEVDLGGLVWLRNRVYDPATRQFLSRDPLAGVPGLTVAANPYHYANNDPIGHIDPLGLQGVLTIEQYNEYADQAYGWQTQNIVTAVTVVAGVALMFVPGVNLLGAVLIGAAFGAVAGAAPAVVQNGMEHGWGLDNVFGDWDWGTIGANALKGAVIGAASGLTGGSINVLTQTGGRFAGLLTGATRAGTAGRNALAGTGLGALDGVVTESYDLTPLPASDGRFDATNIIFDSAIGTGAGGIGGAITHGHTTPTGTPDVTPGGASTPDYVHPAAAHPPNGTPDFGGAAGTPDLSLGPTSEGPGGLGSGASPGDGVPSPAGSGAEPLGADVGGSAGGDPLSGSGAEPLGADVGGSAGGDPLSGRADGAPPSVDNGSSKGPAPGSHDSEVSGLDAGSEHPAVSDQQAGDTGTTDPAGGSTDDLAGDGKKKPGGGDGVDGSLGPDAVRYEAGDYDSAGLPVDGPESGPSGSTDDVAGDGKKKPGGGDGVDGSLGPDAVRYEAGDYDSAGLPVDGSLGPDAAHYAPGDYDSLGIPLARGDGTGPPLDPTADRPPDPSVHDALGPEAGGVDGGASGTGPGARGHGGAESTPVSQEGGPPGGDPTPTVEEAALAAAAVTARPPSHAEPGADIALADRDTPHIHPASGGTQHSDGVRNGGEPPHAAHDDLPAATDDPTVEGADPPASALDHSTDPGAEVPATVEATVRDSDVDSLAGSVGAAEPRSVQAGSVTDRFTEPFPVDVDGQRFTAQATVHAASVIDQVHSVPSTARPLRFNVEERQGLPHGEYLADIRELTVAPVDGDRSRIANALNPRHSSAELTFVHEFGHYLDFEAFGTPGSSASRGNDMSDVMDTIRATDHYQRLDGMRGATTDPAELRDLNYLLDDAELFARAYSQWVAERSMDPMLLSQLDGYRLPVTDRELAFRRDYVWPDEDFAPVAAAFDDLFRDHPPRGHDFGGNPAEPLDPHLDQPGDHSPATADQGLDTDSSPRTLHTDPQSGPPPVDETPAAAGRDRTGPPLDPAADPTADPDLDLDPAADLAADPASVRRPPEGASPDQSGPWASGARVEEWRETWWGDDHPAVTLNGGETTVPVRNPSVDHIPDGQPEAIHPNEAPQMRADKTFQNDNAVLLAQHGLEVRQQPGIDDSGSRVVGPSGNPITADYSINGHLFDHKVPHTENAGSFVGNTLFNAARRYLERGSQADRFVVHLDGTPITPELLADALERHQQRTTSTVRIQEVLVVWAGNVIPIWPAS